MFNHNQFAVNVVLVSGACLSVLSPAPDCRMHALDTGAPSVNKFHRVSKQKGSGDFSLANPNHHLFFPFLHPCMIGISFALWG